jgi:predicted hydrolase (HD superfamily)
MEFGEEFHTKRSDKISKLNFNKKEMGRQKYYDAVKMQLEPKIFTHSLELEACMEGLYNYFSENGLLAADEPAVEEWKIAGLTHDIDYSGEYKEEHPGKTQVLFDKYGIELTENVHNMIKAHAPDLTGYYPKSKAEWSIFCADSLTGLIAAVAYVYPSKTLAEVKLSSVMKRFLKEPKFAAGTRREEVAMCEKPEGLNLPLEKFVDICLTSMQKIAKEVGL